MADKEFIRKNLIDYQLIEFIRTLTKHDIDLLNSQIKEDDYLSGLSLDDRLEYFEIEYKKIFDKEKSRDWQNFNGLSLNEKIALRAFKNVMNQRHNKSVYTRTAEMYNRSLDFKNALLILLEDEERYFRELAESCNKDEVETSLSDYIVFEEGQFDRLEKIALNVSTSILEQFEEDYKEIEFLQGKQRELRILDFKKELFEQIIKTNCLYILNEHYGQVYEKEMRKFLSIC
ncbi:hypothetical protein [Polaribacter aquimarinus]|uniref:Uncharacterized protein n=1 Tax=Polaribacter aquimarinus TaxID=2100726 RepID=A0A2U2JE30_9FLAO|nr:hypothetical protein [Polaribacter aquimarinus]PWG06572.1 hypothetical protein DIS07_01685 [Polaribacter aquimarinus]